MYKVQIQVYKETTKNEKQNMLENKVKEIRKYKTAKVYNSHHNMTYTIKEYIEIEYFNGHIVKLDKQSKTDITDYNYLTITHKGKQTQTLFINELA